MAKSNVLLIVVLVCMLLVVFNPQVRQQAFSVWQALKPVFTGIKDGLTVLINEISNKASDTPSDDRPPANTGPVYNI